MANEHIINNNLIITGSVSSSVGFSGDGSGLTNITSTAEWDGSRDGNASITGSLVVSSSSANVDLLNVGGGVSGSFSGSFKGNGSGLTDLNISNLTASDTNISGSFSGSFEGDGSGLTGLNNFPFNGDAVISGSLTVSGSNVDLTLATGASGSFSGSFEGDGSGLTNLPSQEWDGSRDGDSSITGSLVVSGSTITVELKGDTTLDENIFISNTGDSTSIGIGSGSLEETTQSRNTIAIGLQAGNLLISGSSNVYIGNEAGETATQTVGDTAVGHQALQASTGIDTGDGSNNSCNTAVGFQALKSNTTGEKGTAIGANALESNTEGLCNTAVGHEAGCNITTGDKNTILGDKSGICLTTNSENTLIGSCAGARLEGDGHVSVGKDSLQGTGDITGNYNTAVGTGAGKNLTGGSAQNVFIGVNAGPSASTTESNKLYINNAAGTPLIKGDFSTCQVEFRGGITGSSFTGSFTGDGSNLSNITTTPDTQFQIFVTGSGANSINTVTGSNIANDLFSSVLGGQGNRSTGDYSILVGGLYNTASANYSFVGGGTNNNLAITALSSSILGGFNNSSSCANTHILGSNLTADKSNYTFINNLDVEGTISGSTFSGSFVGSGAGLTGLPTGEWDGSRDGDSSITGSLILSGSNINLDVRGVISGSTKLTIGSGHTNLGTLTSIGGGQNNNVGNVAHCSTIGGGCANEVYRPYSAVLGGNLNIVCNTYGSIVGGLGNKIDNTTNFSFIGGGYLNKVEGSACGVGILSGCKNIHTNGIFSSIAGGTLNTSSADLGAILGGTNNNLQHNCSFIIGDSITSDKACYTFMNNLDVAGTVSASVFSGSFVGNVSNLDIAAGSNTEIQFNNSGVLGASAAFTFTDSDTLTIGDTTTGGSNGQILLKEEDNGSTATIINGNNNFRLYRTNVSNALKHDGTNWQVESSTESTSTSTGALTVSGGVGIAKNLHVGGTITANEIVTNIVSQSIALATGSNIFGDELTDLHQFTGSLSITGSVVGDLSASGTITGNSGSFNHVAVGNLTFEGSTIQAPGGSPVNINDDLTLSTNDLSGVDNLTANSGSFSGGLTSNGYVILSQVSQSLNFQNDTEAAAGGVPLGGLYRNGNFIAIRLI